jgi:iron complex transport system ATP-binding protein
MSVLLEARDVGYRIGAAELLRGVDLALERGRLLAIGGPNGAGKSTLLKVLAGELEPSSGQVLLDGRLLAGFRPRELARRRAVLPQQTILQFAFSAEEVVELGRSPHRRRFGGWTTNDVRAVQEAMEGVDVGPLAARSFPSLSAGEQARVSLARVLAQETELLLLDEPTAALDLRHQELVMQLARELVDRGRTVVAVVHDLNLAARHADDVALLKDGGLAALGSPWDVLTEATVEAVFEQPVCVLPHPGCDRPVVVTAASAREESESTGATLAGLPT